MKYSLIAVFLVLGNLLAPETGFGQKRAKGDFILWQLPSQSNNIMNSYVFLTSEGKVCVMDGGYKGDASYLRGFLAALGNEVEAWFVSHPHDDHVEALNEILKEPGGIKIKTIYHSEMSAAYYNAYEPNSRAGTAGFYDNLRKFRGKVVDLTTPGEVIRVSNTYFKVLRVKNEQITANPYNNQSVVIKVWDRKKSVLFLGDLGREGGDELLKSSFAKELNSDYIQLAHHGQRGVSDDFYRAISFKACLWPTPSWLYHNDVGGGYNTANYETVHTRELMRDLGITQHYIAFEGLARIE